MKTTQSKTRSDSFQLMVLAAIFIFGIWMTRTCSTTVPPELNPYELPTVTIAHLRSHITELDRQPVVLEGKVLYSWYTSFPNGGFYTLDDGTGQITVMKQGLTPEQGAWLKVAVEPKAIARIGANTGIAAAEIEILSTGISLVEK